jgi:alpha-D-xyloside xylohydrolase
MPTTGCRSRLPLAVQARTANQLILDGFYYQTASGRSLLPETLTSKISRGARSDLHVRIPDGRILRLSFERQGSSSLLSLSATPDTGIVGWGFGIDCAADEYYTGLMERLVDGPQQETWAPGRTDVNLHGQKVDMTSRSMSSAFPISANR